MPQPPKRTDTSAKKCEPPQVEQVRKWIISGASAYDIAEAIAKAFPDANAAALMIAAMKELETAANFDPAVVQGWCFEATRDLYRRMVDIGDYPGALRAVKQIADMAVKVSRQEPEADEAAE